MRNCNLCLECLEVIFNPKHFVGSLSQDIDSLANKLARTNVKRCGIMVFGNLGTAWVHSWLSLSLPAQQKFQLIKNVLLQIYLFLPAWKFRVFSGLQRLDLVGPRNSLPLHLYVDWWRCKSLTWRKEKAKLFWCK